MNHRGGTSGDHAALQGLDQDDHEQYLLEDGTRALSGDLDLGGNAVTNVGNVDGRDVSADGSKLDGIESGATADQTAGEIESIVSHDNLLDFDAAEHRTINDSGTGATDLWSGSKIDSELSGIVAGDQYVDVDGDSGTTAISGSTVVPLNSAVEASDAGDFTVDAANDELVFEVTGVYLVIASCTTQATTNTRTQTRFWIQVHDGVSWSTLTHTLRWMYNRNIAEGNGGGTTHLIVSATGGTTKVRMQAAEASGGGSEIDNDSCSMTVVRVA